MDLFESIANLLDGGAEHFLQHNRNITPNEFEERFHIIVSDTTEECSICRLELKDYVKTECGHRFHKECLKKWLFESRRCKTDCPMCRTEIKTANYSEEDEQAIKDQLQKMRDGVDTATAAFMALGSLILNSHGHDHGSST